jgi:uncharacterized protein YndB with AHSA1/START domain
MTAHEDLATFDDRWTLRYVRVFRAPVERVWRAVTTSEELNIWLYPVSRVEPKLGGRVTFTWGSPEHDPQVGEVTVFEPLRRIRFQWRKPGVPLMNSSPGYLEFALEPVPEGTRFTFVDKSDPEFRQDQSGLDPKNKAVSLPAGPDTPWRPGFVAGYHLNFEHLGQFMLEDWSPQRIHEVSEKQIGIANGTDKKAFASEIAFLEGRGAEHARIWSELVEVYWAHIQRTCPPPHARR